MPGRPGRTAAGPGGPGSAGVPHPPTSPSRPWAASLVAQGGHLRRLPAARRRVPPRRPGSAPVAGVVAPPPSVGPQRRLGHLAVGRLGQRSRSPAGRTAPTWCRGRPGRPGTRRRRRGRTVAGQELQGGHDLVAACGGRAPRRRPRPPQGRTTHQRAGVAHAGLLEKDIPGPTLADARGNQRPGLSLSGGDHHNRRATSWP